MDCLPQIHVAAAHSQPGREAFVPGVGVLCEDGSLRLGAGMYRNSSDRTSAYTMAGWMPLTIGPVRVGLAAGLATGYEIAVAPIGGLSLEFPFDWGSVYALAMPRTPRSPAVLGLSFTMRVGQ